MAPETTANTVSEYQRLEQWRDFSKQVELHIEQYTKVQYGNPEGDEQADRFTIDECWSNLNRYYNRRNSNTRGNKEKLRDVLKIAHYAQFIYNKLKTALDEPDVYKE